MLYETAFMLIPLKSILITIGIISFSIGCFSLVGNFVFAQNSNQSFESNEEGLRLQYPSLWDNIDSYLHDPGIAFSPKSNSQCTIIYISRRRLRRRSKNKF